MSLGEYRVKWADNDRVSSVLLTRLMSRLVLTVEGEAKRRVPVKTGTLRRSITSTVENSGQRGRVGTSLRYALWVHEGTEPHVIRPKNKKALAWRAGPVAYRLSDRRAQYTSAKTGKLVVTKELGAKIVRREVHHPGTRPQPFLTEALAASRDTLDRIIRAGARSWLKEALP